MRIYVAGPYTSNENRELDNVNRAIDVARELIARGHDPFIPHLTHFVGERIATTGRSLSYEDYLAWDFVWLEQ